MNAIQQLQQKHQKEIQELINRTAEQERRAYIKRTTPAQRVADVLHMTLCCLSHSERPQEKGWCDYHTAEWGENLVSRVAKPAYLKRAEQILALGHTEQAVEAIVGALAPIPGR